MLCKECVKFFDQKWRHEFTKAGNYRETGQFQSQAAMLDRLARPTGCELCTFVYACPKSTNREGLSRKISSKDAPQYEVYLWSILSGVEHRLNIVTLDGSGNGPAVQLNLNRASGIHAWLFGV
jgi:hypothetical protein